MTDIARVYMSH